MSTFLFTWNPLSDSVMEEIDDANTVLATYTNKPRPFGPLVSQNRGDEVSQFHFDALGSTRLLTNSSQTPTDTYVYDAWGTMLFSTGATANAYTWNGQAGYFFDSGLGVYYVRSRAYAPVMARWTSIDPLGLFIDYVLYRYCYNSPSQLTDNSGNAPLGAAAAEYMAVLSLLSQSLDEPASPITHSLEVGNWTLEVRHIRGLTNNTPDYDIFWSASAEIKNTAYPNAKANRQIWIINRSTIRSLIYDAATETCNWSTTEDTVIDVFAATVGAQGGAINWPGDHTFLEEYTGDATDICLLTVTVVKSVFLNTPPETLRLMDNAPVPAGSPIPGLMEAAGEPAFKTGSIYVYAGGGICNWCGLTCLGGIEAECVISPFGIICNQDWNGL